MTNPFSNTDSLSTMDFGQTTLPSKSAVSPVSSDIPTVLSTPSLHKRRPLKRVRFALTLEPVDEDAGPSSPEMSPNLLVKRTKQPFEYSTQTRPLYGNYIEYLKKQNTLQNHETQTDRTPSPLSSSETSTDSPTYTHTFVIQSKSPTILINSITVSNPPLHLPQIVHRKKQPTRTQSLTVDSSLKQQQQQLTLSTPPHMLHTRKLANSTSQRHHYVSIQALPKRKESTPTITSATHLSDKIDNSIRSKPIKDDSTIKKLPEIVMNKPTLNALSDRSTLPNYLRKPRIPSRLHRSNDEIKLNPKYFFQYHDYEQLLLPIIHSSH
ncbi:hypothetical protein I4U23_020797 [Adineta vaga]|nr:hypothetical protein I4U23_020797 [Adineta vaga]